jgi:hypothetical protein
MGAGFRLRLLGQKKIQVILMVVYGCMVGTIWGLGDLGDALFQNFSNLRNPKFVFFSFRSEIFEKV